MKRVVKVLKRINEVSAAIAGIIVSIPIIINTILGNGWQVASYACAGILIAIALFILYKINARKTVNSSIELPHSAQNTVPEFNKRIRRRATAAVILLALTSTVLIVSPLATKTPSVCNEENLKLGLVVADFSNSEDDMLAMFLIDELVTGVNSDTVLVTGLGRKAKFMTTRFYPDTTNKIIESVCTDKGIVACGNRNTEEEALIARIYLVNMLRCDTMVDFTDQISLKHPDFIDFTLQIQAKVMADFILGIYHYYGCSNKLAISYLEASKKNASENGSRFTSWCDFYIGNTYLLTDQIDSAISSYSAALAIDSLNPDLNYNLGIALKSDDQLLLANKYFERAENIGANHRNPLRSETLAALKQGNATSNFSPTTFQTSESQVESYGPLIATYDSKDQPNPYHGKSKASYNGKYGCINSQDHLLIPFIYDEIRNLYDQEYVIVRQGDKFGCMSLSNEIILPLKYDNLDGFSSGLARACKDGKYGFIDMNDSIAIPFIYDDVRWFDGEFAFAKIETKWGLINKQNQVVIPFRYDDSRNTHKGIAIVKKGKYWGMINFDGETTLEFKYHKLGYFNQGIATVRHYEKCGYINYLGEYIMPLKYEEASNFYAGLVCVGHDVGACTYHIYRDGSFREYRKSKDNQRAYNTATLKFRIARDRLEKWHSYRSQ